MITHFKKNEEKMDERCVLEKNKAGRICYADNLIDPIYGFPVNFAECVVSKYDFFMCRMKEYKKSNDSKKN